MLSPEPKPEGRRTTDALATEFADRMSEVLCAGNGLRAEAIVDEALAVGLSPTDVQSLVIAPAMVRVGDLWESGVVTVAEEHLATSISQRVLVKLFAAMLAGSSKEVHLGQRIVLAAIQGQHHVLGLRMVADVLETAGFDVVYLGADTPVGSLRSFIAKHQPGVVGLTIGTSIAAGWLADSLWAIHQVAPEARIMLGGRAVPQSLRDSYPYITSSSDVVHVVKQLLSEPAPPAPRIVNALRSGSAALTQPVKPSEETNDIAARWASAADDAVELAREHVRRAQTYRNLAFRDSLTGLGNRRAFEDELAALTGSQVGGAVLMIDVDRFKAVNDEHGHAAGDQLLCSIADAIIASVRAADTPARVGGDEFAVLLPGASLDVAVKVGERVRAAAVASSALRVSVSVGVSALADDPRAAMLSADLALYEAKTAGRDRVARSQSGAGSAESQAVRDNVMSIDVPAGDRL